MTKNSDLPITRTGILDAESEPATAKNEAEVTPEMIEAGIDAFYGFHWGDCPEIDGREIRKAMHAAFIAMPEARP